jgi:hypothetical protein
MMPRKKSAESKLRGGASYRVYATFGNSPHDKPVLTATIEVSPGFDYA